MILKEGLALDIDETLSWTFGFWVENLQKRFGNPENLSVEEMFNKYKFTQNVPYWQSEEALAWMEEHRNHNGLQKELSLIEGSNIYVPKVNKIIPISVYLTTRPDTVIKGTKHWLDKHGFPEAPIICRPSLIPTEEGDAWKALKLKELYPTIKGIVDDNARVLQSLEPDYKGVLFYFQHDTVDSVIRAIPCKTWEKVYEAVKKEFMQN